MPSGSDGRFAAPSGSDHAKIRDLLVPAQGYAVFGREGKRVGAFIELVVRDPQRIAIRHDGVFLWRRRTLPIATVAKVLPEQRAVVLNVDRRALAASAVATTQVDDIPGSSDEPADVQEAWRKRIDRYVSPGEDEIDQTSADCASVDGEPSAEIAESERAVASAVPQSMAEPTDRSAARHLLFISTSGGYALAERDGEPPVLGAGIELPEQPGSFFVAKLGPSPLPNDARICAYLEHDL